MYCFGFISLTSYPRNPLCLFVAIIIVIRIVVIVVVIIIVVIIDLIIVIVICIAIIDYAIIATVIIAILLCYLLLFTIMCVAIIAIIAVICVYENGLNKLLYVRDNLVEHRCELLYAQTRTLTLTHTETKYDKGGSYGPADPTGLKRKVIIRLMK